MRIFFFILLGIFFSFYANAQVYKVDLEATLVKDYKHFNKGDKVKISHVIHDVTMDSYYGRTSGRNTTDEDDNNFYSGKVEDVYSIVIGTDTVPVSNKIGDFFDFAYDNVQDLWDSKIISNVLFSLQKKGIQNSLRNEMEEEALEYISKQKEYNLVLNDPYLENYIYSLISKIAPVDIIDGRPGNVNILIVDNPLLNAGMYSNGTMVINTGLLSALHTEDELVAILSHEIAHFVLDHSVQNVNKAKARKKRAEFWAAFATGITAVAEGVAASKNQYYIPGAATLGMAVLSSSIASQIVERLGMNYNAEQEEEADNIAIKVLELLGYDKNALATALNRMQDNMVKERSNMMYFQSYTHPALVERIKKAGTPQDVIDSGYEKEISFAITSSARMKFEDRRFRQALPLVDININNGVATAEDYILKANCLLALYNNEKSNNEILKLIAKAKEIDASNINLYKAEILGNLRLRNFLVAQQLLAGYITTLTEMEAELKNIESDITWDACRGFILSERNWAEKMLVKVKVMQ